MFLSKKSLIKILVLPIICFVVGVIGLYFAIVAALLDIDSTMLFILSILLFLWGVLGIFTFLKNEGKVKYIKLANKLVNNELRPAEFIKEYELLRNSQDLVIKKPSIEILQLVLAAYDSLGDEENSLAIADEMIAVASDKKKSYAKLMKSAILFSHGKVEEAEAIFSEAQSGKRDFLTIALTDILIKSDRAIAMGDYKIAEAYFLSSLEQTFPKPSNLSKLSGHYGLGEIYEKTGEKEKALTHYQYCAENGGETYMKSAAEAAIKRLG